MGNWNRPATTVVLTGICIALASVSAAVQAGAPIDVGAFIRKDAFTDIKLSPDGKYLAATVQQEDRTALVVLDRQEIRITGSMSLGRHNHVADFWWVNAERVLFSVAQKFGALDSPQMTGELFAMSADGTNKENLLGYRVEGAGPGTRIQQKKVEAVAGYLVDTLPEDDRNVIVMVRPFGDLTYTRAEKMDVYTGRRVLLARSPVPEAEFVSDGAGTVRFAYGITSENVNRLYYRAGEHQEWDLINDERMSQRIEVPVGFSADQKTAYLRVEQAQGSDAMVALDVASGKRTEVLRNPNVDPADILRSHDGKGVPMGAVFFDGKPTFSLLDKEQADGRLLRSLQQAFPGEFVEITSMTRDGTLALVEVSSDVNPGDFYVFDVPAKKMNYLLSRREWVDPEQLAPMAPVQLKARDGLVLHGYLTVPKGSSGKGLPLIIHPHGGPYGVRDVWGFNSEVQLLASAGYAVLQVNYRGSGGYGRNFQQVGARQWGGTMQDDLTDATRWAIKEGIADPGKICIYGASYGAYAALMGAAKEAGLYRCAAGNVGVYDLPMMQQQDASDSRNLGLWSRDWVGEPSTLAAVSPVNMSNRIKVPVFLAAGGEDEVAPVEHTEIMERKLKAAGVPVEAVYYRTEGHGYYKEENQRDYYTKLLAFFSRHLGGATAK